MITKFERDQLAKKAESSGLQLDEILYAISQVTVWHDQPPEPGLYYSESCDDWRIIVKEQP